MTLDEAMTRYAADKYSKGHNYAKAYGDYLTVFGGSKNPNFKFLEIGVSAGQSIRGWLDFLPLAQITGVDINPAPVELAHERFKFFQGAQADESFMRMVGMQRGPFDMVVDDASHKVLDQIASFKILWRDHVAPLGVYVIEDIQCWFDQSQGPLHNAGWEPFLHSLCSLVNHSGLDYLCRPSGAVEATNPPHDVSAIGMDKGRLWIYKK